MPTEAIIVLVVILVLFGGSQIPKLAKNLGKAQSEFKTGLSEGQTEAEVEKAKAEQLRRDTNTSPEPTPPSSVDPARREQPPPD